jgi:phospholipid transport system substrate-binding protein
MRLNSKTFICPLLVVLISASPILADVLSPKSVVEGFQAHLLDVMKRAKTLGVKGRFSALKPVIESVFHQPLMLATATAPYWRNGSPQQKSKLLAAFRRMSASTLATLFDGYSGEYFVFRRQRIPSPQVTIVDAQIIRQDASPVNISYVTAKFKSRWWIIDVIVSGGISEVKSRRSEYSAFLRDGGIDLLTAELNTTADKLLSGRAKVFPR